MAENVVLEGHTVEEEHGGGKPFQRCRPVH
jgi:hypothetical protein